MVSTTKLEGALRAGPRVALAVIALLLVAGCATTSNEIRMDKAPDLKAVTAIKATMAPFDRLLPVHYRLTIAGEPLCSEKLYPVGPDGRFDSALIFGAVALR